MPKTTIGSATPATYAVSVPTRLVHAVPISIAATPVTAREALPTRRLSREVTVAGEHDHLEIRDRAKWRQQLHEVEGSAEDVAERLAN